MCWQKLLGWRIDRERNRAAITEASTGKEMLELSFDEEELGEDIRQITGIYFTWRPHYVFEDGKIFMECQPSLVFEQRVTPHVFEQVLRMEVLYQENSEGTLIPAED